MNKAWNKSNNSMNKAWNKSNNSMKKKIDMITQ